MNSFADIKILSMLRKIQLEYKQRIAWIIIGATSKIQKREFVQIESYSPYLSLDFAHG